MAWELLLENPIMRALSLLLASGLVGLASAQNRTVLPTACTTLPGNAALSLPLRWSHGTLQVRMFSSMLPSGLLGKTISGIRLRRPAFLTEPAYPAMQRTLTVRGAFQPISLGNLTPDRQINNQQGTAPVLFGPAVVSVPATPATTAGNSVGSEFLVIPFTTPLLVVAGSLFFEFESSDGPLQVGTDHWVDAVWFADGVETGYAVPVGNGSCTTRTEPTELVWTNAEGPHVTGTANLRLSGAAPGLPVFAWLGLAPEPRAVSATYFGWGGSLGLLAPSMAACHQWAPIDVMWSGTASASGAYSMSFALPATFATIGLRIGVQTAWIDLARAGVPLSVSNGVMLVLDTIGVGQRCSTAFFPAGATYSPWVPEIGQMPVITLEHN